MGNALCLIGPIFLSARPAARAASVTTDPRENKVRKDQSDVVRWVARTFDNKDWDHDSSAKHKDVAVCLDWARSIGTERFMTAQRYAETLGYSKPNLPRVTAANVGRWLVVTQ